MAIQNRIDEDSQTPQKRDGVRDEPPSVGQGEMSSPDGNTSPQDVHLTDATLWGEAQQAAPALRKPFVFPWKAAIACTVTAALGIGIGLLIARQRYHAQNLVLSVNGGLIESHDFYHRLEAVAGPQVLNQMMAEQLTLQYADKVHARPTKEQIEAQFKKVSDRKDWGIYLAGSGQTNEDVKRTIEVELAQKAIVSQGLRATEEETQAYYKQQTDPKNPAAKYYTPPGVRVSVIVTPQETQSRAAAAELANSVAFDKVALKYSIDPSKNAGGVLPTVLKGRTASARIPGLEARVFGMDVGAQLGPLKIGNVWWIIRCLEKIPEKVEPYEKVKDECQQEATVQKSLRQRGMKVKEEFSNFRNSSKIVSFWPQYRNMGNQR